MSTVNWTSVFEHLTTTNRERILWFNIKNIVGELIMLAIIPLGMWQIFEHDLSAQPILPLFVGCAAIYLLNRYVFHPLCVYSFGRHNSFGRSAILPEYSGFNGFLCSGEMFLTSRTRLSSVSGMNENITYRFITLLYLPIFPFACCKDPQKMRDGINDGLIRYYKCKWRWQEVIYIYLRNCSTFFMVFCTLMMLVD